jgi:hypothetical protein
MAFSSWQLVAFPFLFVPLLTASGAARAQDDGARFTSFSGFTLGKMTLRQVSRVLGPTPLLESRETGQYAARICYRVPGGQVYFLSGETGGPAHQLLGFGLSSKPEDCAEPRNARLPKPLQIAGLKLGMSRDEFSRRMPANLRWYGETGRAVFSSRRLMTSDELNALPEGVRNAIFAGKLQNHLDVTVAVTGIFSRDKLVEFRVWRDETL